MTIPTELDDLFADALQAERKFPSRTVRNAKPEPEKKISTLEKYSLPEFWIAGRKLLLVHEETQTALGAFQEYSHKTEKGARKLVRIEDVVHSISCLEYVRGDGWLGPREEELVCEPQRWAEEREIILPDLLLRSFDVHAEAVAVRVKLSYGGISRVELTDHTTFHSPDGKTALTIAAGTNVYEVMDLDAKVALRKELGK